MTENGPSSDEIYAVKMAILKKINEERENAGIKPLILDTNIAEAADEHCKEMIDNKYSSHWNLAGEKPYQRYFKAGCRDHITEIFGGYDAPEETTFDISNEGILKQAVDMHEKTMNASGTEEERNSSSVLDPLHTHIGIGLSVTTGSFRMLEVYLDRYVSIDDEVSPTMTETKINFQGSMIEMEGNWGPYACVVYYDPSPEALSPDDATAKEGYEDFSHHQAAVTWPWEMSFKDGQFSIPIDFEEVREGYYYVHLHVRDNADTIPYNEVQEGLQVPGDGTVVATGFVFHYRGKTLKRGEVTSAANGVSIDDVISDIRVTTASSQEGKQSEDLSEYEHILLGDPISSVSSGLSIYFAKGERGELDPITDIKYVTGNDENMEGPEGYEVIRVSIATATPDADAAGKAEAIQNAFEELIKLTTEANADASNSSVASYMWENEEIRNNLSNVGVDPANVRAALEADPDNTWTVEQYVAELSTPAPGAFTYLCVKRGELTDALTAVSLVFGENPVMVAQAALGEDDISILSLPFENMCIAYTKVNASLDVVDESMMQSLAGDDAFATTDEDSDAAYIQRAEEEAAQRKIMEEKQRANQRESLIQLLQEAEEENKKLIESNQGFQRKLVKHLQGLAAAKKAVEDPVKSVEDQAKRKSDMEIAKQYRDALKNVNDAKDAIDREQSQYDEIALQLQDRLDEKEEKAENIRKSFATFKREIALASENSRTGRPIPKKIVGKFEATEDEKDNDVSKVRLRNINLKMQLKKLEGKLREKEQLADGLHLIDFEQLKIENQTLNEKIEERNEDLHKLRKKTTTTVQVLTHIKEKLQFEQAQNEVLKSQLATLDGELTAERDQLAKAKREREKCRNENSKLQGEQGFVNNDMLVQDYERRKILIREMKAKCGELQATYVNITDVIKRASGQ